MCYYALFVPSELRVNLQHSIYKTLMEPDIPSGLESNVTSRRFFVLKFRTSLASQPVEFEQVSNSVLFEFRPYSSTGTLPFTRSVMFDELSTSAATVADFCR